MKKIDNQASIANTAKNSPNRKVEFYCESSLDYSKYVTRPQAGEPYDADFIYSLNFSDTGGGNADGDRNSMYIPLI